jgi:HTH-type transcriptional regulator/antitoxin HigA
MHLRRDDDTILESLFERTEVEVDDVEAAVNRDAANYLLPPAALQEFLSRTESRPTRDEISSFAASIGRHPGIVVGRLQRDHVVDWSEHRPLLVKVRQHLEDQIAA